MSDSPIRPPQCRCWTARACRIAKFPTILYDVAQAYRRLYETEQNVQHLKKAIDSYRIFLMNAPHAKQHAVAQKFLAMLDLELIETQNYGPKTASVGRLPVEAIPQPVHDGPRPTVDKSATAPVVVATAPQGTKTPVYKKWWLWTAVGVGAAAVALGAGLGVGLAKGPICVGKCDGQ